MITRLEEIIDLVPNPTPELTNETVERALKDSMQLLATSGGASAVDRVYTQNTLRNRSSMAHPNDEIIEEAEAILAVNSTRTILNYVTAILKYKN